MVLTLQQLIRLDGVEDDLPGSDGFYKRANHSRKFYSKFHALCLDDKLISMLRSAKITSPIRSPHVGEWLRAWDTLTMFEATVCGRS